MVVVENGHLNLLSGNSGNHISPLPRVCWSFVVAVLECVCAGDRPEVNTYAHLRSFLSLHLSLGLCNDFLNPPVFCRHVVFECPNP